MLFGNKIANIDQNLQQILDMLQTNIMTVLSESETQVLHMIKNPEIYQISSDKNCPLNEDNQD